MKPFDMSSDKDNSPSPDMMQHTIRNARSTKSRSTQKTRRNKSNPSNPSPHMIHKMWDTVKEIKTKLEDSPEIVVDEQPSVENEDPNARMFTCTNCGAPTEYQSNGFAICTNNACSQIHENILDHSPEWRFYGADDAHGVDPARCGAIINPLMKEAAFGCRVNNVKKCSREMQRLGRYTEWMTPYDQKVLYKDFSYITIMSQNAGIPKIIIDASFVYYKRFLDYKQSFRGDNKGGLIVAATYTACRLHNCPRSAKELATIYHINPTAATNGCKLAQKIINEMESTLDSTLKTVFNTLQPQDFIERYCTHLDFPTELTSLCLFITKKVESSQYMAENTPNSIAAGVAYFVGNMFHLQITKTQVKDVSDISEMTINKCYKKLVELSSQLIPAVLLRKYNCSLPA